MKRIEKLILMAFVLISTVATSEILANPAPTGGTEIILADKLPGTEGITLCPNGKLFTVKSDKDSGKVFEIINDTTVELLAEGFKGPAGIACGSNGDLYIAEYGSGSVQSLSADGKTRKVIASGYKTPNGIAVSSDGTVYMSDSTAGKVVEISVSGKTETLLAGINFANGLLLSPDEKFLYIAQTTPNKVIITPLTGKNRGRKKTYSSKLRMVDGITADVDGNLYACLFSTGEIAKVNKDGLITIIASNLYTPATPAIKNGTLYVTSVKGKGLYKIPLPENQLND